MPPPLANDSSGPTKIYQPSSPVVTQTPVAAEAGVAAPDRYRHSGIPSFNVIARPRQLSHIVMPVHGQREGAFCLPALCCLLESIQFQRITVRRR
jgi:hypothetical protein